MYTVYIVYIYIYIHLYTYISDMRYDMRYDNDVHLVAFASGQVHLRRWTFFPTQNPVVHPQTTFALFWRLKTHAKKAESPT